MSSAFIATELRAPDATVNIASLQEEAVIDTFGLVHPIDFESRAARFWDVRADTQPRCPVTTTPFLTRFMRTYSQNFQRNSERVCRFAIDVMLNEALIILKDQESAIDGFDQPPSPNDYPQKKHARAKTPTQYSKLGVFAGFSLSYLHRPTNTRYSGCIDYGVGFITRPAHTNKRQYYSCLLVIQAKRQGAVDDARGQLLAYMACVQAKRREQGRPDACVYGIATDGYEYEFLQIDSHNNYRKSGRLNVYLGEGDLLCVLKSIVYVLEKTFDSTTPFLSPDRPKATSNNLTTSTAEIPFVPDDEIVDINRRAAYIYVSNGSRNPSLGVASDDDD